MLSIQKDDFFMKLALTEANRAFEKNEVPVGAVVVWDGRVISRAHNQTEQLKDCTAHAEMLAITAAANHIGSKFLTECHVFVTLEPCPMCAGALYWARPARVCYAASDDKRGFMRYGKDMLHPKTSLEFGLMSDDAASLMKSFFHEKR